MVSGTLGSTQTLGATALLGSLFSPGPIFVAGAVAVAWLFVQRSRSIRYSLDQSLAACAVASVCGLVGARLFGLVASGTILELEPMDWVGAKGSASWGVYLGALLGFLLYARLARRCARPTLDVAGSAAGLGTFFGRIGCLVTGCDFGQVTAVPWAVHYPPGTHPFLGHVSAGQLAPDAVRSLGVHPMQFYLAVNGLFVFLLVSAIWRRWRHVPGVTLASFWILYGTTRFFWEFLRDPAAGGALSGLSLSQIMALVAVAIGAVIGMVVLRRERAQRLAPTAPVTVSR